MVAAEDFTGLTMIRNEAYWIEFVLFAPLQILPRVIVADTGSEDGTLDILHTLQKNHTNLELWELGELSPEEIGDLRTEMMRDIHSPFGFQIDGDEVYSVQMLRDTVEIGMPIGKHTGFTTIYELGEDDEGLFVAKPFSALRILKKGTFFDGSYPWEFPSTWGDIEGYYYFPGDLYGWHVHGLQRSPLDDGTYLRNDKKHQLEVVRRISELPFVAELGCGSFPNPYFKD